MSNELIIGLFSSLIGGVLVAIITHLSAREKNAAEAKKLAAEADKIKAETTKLLTELEIKQNNEEDSRYLPKGWNILGNRTEDYEISVDYHVAHSGKASGTIKSRPNARGFGALTQTIKADKFLGKRVRMSAYVKSEQVKDWWGWAGLWMRVDSLKEKAISFDNMEDRPIKETTNWTKYEIVLNVPQDSDKIVFGLALAGRGQVWIDNRHYID